MALNPPDLNPVDYSVRNIMQEKLYQTHLANMYKVKHWLVHVWAELYHRHVAAAIGNAISISMHVTHVW